MIPIGGEVKESALVFGEGENIGYQLSDLETFQRASFCESFNPLPDKKF